MTMEGIEREDRHAEIMLALSTHKREWAKHRAHDDDLVTSRRILIRLAAEVLPRSEIAALLGVSRQAIEKSLRKTDDEMSGYDRGPHWQCPQCGDIRKPGDDCQCTEA